MLKYFNLKYEYSYDTATCYSFNNAFLAGIINVDFDFDVVDLFLSGLSPSDKISEYVDGLMEENNRLIINQKLKTKSFMNLLEESELIVFLNDLYNKILAEISQ